MNNYIVCFALMLLTLKAAQNDFGLAGRKIVGYAPPVEIFICTPLLAKHQTKGNLYVDDVQSLIHGPPSDPVHVVERINSVSRDLHFWMMTNRLNLNPSKTQLIWFGTRQQLLKLDNKLTALTVPDFTFTSSVRDLNVTLDSELIFADHIIISANAILLLSTETP